MAVGCLVASSTVLFIRNGERACPTVPIEKVPRASAIRTFIETAGEPIVPTSSSISKPRLLSEWSASLKSDRWVPCLVAVQAEVPLQALARYSQSTDGAQGDTSPSLLLQNLCKAYLAGVKKRRETKLLKDDIQPPSLTPGSPFFGQRFNVLGTWISPPGEALDPSALPLTVPCPPSEFPSNKELLSQSKVDAAGAVFYWNFPLDVAAKVDKAAAFGYPFRFMLGGFHELIVEKVSDDKVQISYVLAEVYHLHPLDQQERDFKMIPQWTRVVHREYARSLLRGALAEINQAD
ncbi:hypothetical protein EX895_006378 [Sporisorium graminicola]|uniref:Uncharacterized protein n=1 Tax=Sporisorium graminicola TaxID=280036 RepID=A0A4U7KQ37_9BASI|nr:hypothetical protein EX895_006378 [Sporisorium graminicola]TKY85298.1 hypothetical protein EX895_006378 [Sporisorium graminicola]